MESKVEIAKPVRVRRRADYPFAEYEFRNHTDTVYPAGAVAFPEYDATSQTYNGCLTVCTGDAKTGVVKLCETVYFNWYTPIFWSKLKQIHDDYGIIDYYYDVTREDDANRLRMACESETEAGNRVTVPHLMRVEFPSDFGAFNLLLQRIAAKKFFYRLDSPMHSAIIRWDTDLPFSKAPVEIKAVCAAAYGIDKDLAYYRLEYKGALHA